MPPTGSLSLASTAYEQGSHRIGEPTGEIYKRGLILVDEPQVRRAYLRPAGFRDDMDDMYVINEAHLDGDGTELDAKGSSLRLPRLPTTPQIGASTDCDSLRRLND